MVLLDDAIRTWEYSPLPLSFLDQDRRGPGAGGDAPIDLVAHGEMLLAEFHVLDTDADANPPPSRLVPPEPREGPAPRAQTNTLPAVRAGRVFVLNFRRSGRQASRISRSDA